MSFRSCLALKRTKSKTNTAVCGLEKYALRSVKHIWNDNSETETSIFKLLCIMQPSSGRLLLIKSGYATVSSPTEYIHHKMGFLKF